jgi:multidrug efflux system membrane fusion protein
MRTTFKKLLAPAILSVIAPVALICLTGGCDNQTPTQADQTESAAVDERIPVRTAAVEFVQKSLPIHTTGMLSSAAEQRLSFKIGGVIHRVHVDEGDTVRPGQIMAELDKTEIDAQVSQARQALLKAERDLQRVEGLYRDSSATLELLQNAGTGRDIARESARIAEFNRQYAEIRATSGGKIIKKLMNEGEITGPGTPVFVLFETGADDWIVKVAVSDRDWARAQVGMPAQIRLDAYPDVVFNGRVRDLAPAADPANGLYTVEIGIQPRGRRFAPGMFATVDIQPPKERRYPVIPIEAIMEGDGDKAFVFTLGPDGSSVRKIPVEIAFVEGAQAVIRSGLDGIREVITGGAPYLNERKKAIKQ